MVLTLIDKRFPSLLHLAQGIVPGMSDPVVLEPLFLGITLALTAEEAEAALLEKNEGGQH